MTDGVSPYAAAIERLWWLTFSTLSAVYVIVLIGLGLALWRRRRRETEPAQLQRSVAIAVIVTGIILFAYLAVDLLTGRKLEQLHAAGTEPPLDIKITAQQWWWQIEYEDTLPSRRLTTANELHVPVGRTVRLQLVSGDVIHSFWVPQLNGKHDMLPGKPSRFWLRADSAGVFFGQCAEYCGHQHAKMRIVVVAQTPAQFSAWYEAQLRAAPLPTDNASQAGLDIFLSSNCRACHTIRGTPAAGRNGPDLTHLASRRMIAAGALANTPAMLTRWVNDPQQFKPGAKMPATRLSSQELSLLVSYLSGLR